MKRANKAKIEQAIQIFNQIRHDNRLIQCSTYHRSDNNANGLTACIIDFTEANGWLCERVNVQGGVKANHIIDGDNGKRIGVANYTRTASTGKRGSADIHATIMSKSVKIEVKFGKDRQSKVQKIYQLEAEISGGHYFIVHTFDDYIEFFDTLTASDTIDAKYERIKKICIMKGTISLENYKKHIKKHGPTSMPNARDMYYTAWVDHNIK